MKNAFAKITKVRELSSVCFLIAMFLLVGVVNPSFLSPSNLITCFNGSVMYILLAVGISFVLMIGQIDVSIGSMAFASSQLLPTVYSKYLVTNSIESPSK